jgi:hypothetical protein
LQTSRNIAPSYAVRATLLMKTAGIPGIIADVNVDRYASLRVFVILPPGWRANKASNLTERAD